MRYYRFLIFLVLTTYACGSNTPATITSVEETNANRLYFCIDSTRGRIIVPVRINDSTVANMFFDTGTVDPYVLDSAFFFTNNLSMNLSLVPKKRSVSLPFDNKFNIPVSEYKRTSSVIIGETAIKYNNVTVLNLSPYLDTVINGVFNIPKYDTTHIWELNFDKNYLEIHHYEDFQIPEECIYIPFYPNNLIPFSWDNEFYVKMPLQIMCDKDTLKSNYIYIVDTGIHQYDIFIPPSVAEAVYFEKNGDNWWRTWDGGCTIYKENAVTATVWDSIAIDTLKIYTFDRVVHDKKYIGPNFLKRFNVFFDMRNRHLGLQPVPYKRYKSPNQRTLYYYTDTIPTHEGNYKINYIPNFKANYYKTAGLQVGDEIVLYNGYSYGDIFQGKVRVDDVLKGLDTLVYDILRDGQPTKIVVPIP